MNFCTQCGSTLSEGARFCPKCGAPRPDLPSAASPSPLPPASPAAAPPAPASPAPAPTAKSGSPVLTIILVVLGFFVLVTALGIGACVYVGYRVHKKAAEFKQAYNLDQSGASRGRPGASRVDRDPCSLITKEEMGALLGKDIANVVDRPGQCEYVPSGSNSGVKIALQGNGKLAMRALVAGAKMAGQAAGMAGNAMDQIPGMGDEAYYLFGVLYFRKGDVMVTIEGQDLMLSREQTVAIAQKVATAL
jgi:hypothetical protein